MKIKRVSYEKALAMGPMEFCKDFLFPTMRREHGRGFGMTYWNWKKEEQNATTCYADEVARKIPSCGSVMCIGGTMQAITGCGHDGTLGILLGLEEIKSHALFFNWYRKWGQLCWPETLAYKFEKAKTPAAKEKVAEAVVLLAIKTKGACFT